MNNTLLLELLCFFTVGLLVLSLILSFVLMQVFKQRTFIFYFLYVVLATLFIVSVLVTKFMLLPAPVYWFNVLLFVFDTVQVPIFLCHTFFVYKAIQSETNTLDQFIKYINVYFVFCFCYFIFRLFISLHIIDISTTIYTYINTFYWVQYLSIPLLMLYRLWQNRANAYLKYLFIGNVLVLFFGILTMFDSVIFTNNIYKGFQFLLVGFIFDSIFFNLAFIYKSYHTYIDKIKAEYATQAKMTTLHLEVQQQTLQEVSKELHDNVGQKLTLASLYTQQVVATINNEKIVDIGEIIDESLQELRHISKSLTSKYIEENSLKTLLLKEISKIEKLKQYVIQYNIEDIEINSTLKKTIIVRIVQEFFQNAIKYAHCNQFILHIKNTPHGIDIYLNDNGIGFNFNESNIYTGNGLSNINTRVALIAGTFTLQSSINMGTTFNILIPNQ